MKMSGEEEERVAKCVPMRNAVHGDKSDRDMLGTTKNESTKEILRGLCFIDVSSMPK